MQSLFARIGALQILGALTFVARTKLSALILGPAGIGLVSVIDQFVQLVMQLSAFAIPYAAIKVLSKTHSESAKAFGAAYASLLRLLLMLGATGAALGVASILIRPGWLGVSLAAHTPLVVMGLVAVPAMILHGFFRNVPAAAMRPLTSAVWDVITAAIMAGSVSLGIVLFQVPGYFAGGLVGCVAVSISYYAYIARRFGLSIVGSPSSIRGILKANPSFVELSLTSYVIAFVTPLALFIVRMTVLDNFGAATAGMLQAAVGISLAVNLILNPLNGLVLTPLVNRMIGDGKKHQETVAFQKKLLLAITIVALPPCLFPDLAVIVLYSSQFIEVADVLYWFVLGQAMMQICGVHTALMVGLDRLKAYALIMVVGAGANAALAVLLVPHYGLLGAGIATFSSASLLTFGTFAYLWARAGFRSGFSVGLTTLLVFAGLGLAGAFVGMRPSLETPNLIAKLLVFAVAVGLMVPLSLDRNERRGLFAGLAFRQQRL